MVAYGHPSGAARQVARTLPDGCEDELALPWRFDAQEFEAGHPGKQRFLQIGDFEPCLQWLSANCPGAVEAAQMADHVQRHQVRLNLPLSVTAVALVQTLLAFGLVRAFQTVHLHGSMWLPESETMAFIPNAGLFRNAALDVRIGELEILGFLAIQIAHAMPGALLVDVPWTTSAQPVEYAPVVLQGVRPSTVLIRKRADERSLLRLFRRHAQSRYRVASDGELVGRFGAGVVHGPSLVQAPRSEAG